jgi:hypothetical protein
MKTLVLLFFMAMCSVVSAKTYFVAPPNANPAGKDSNPGIKTAPWATFGKAVRVAVAGDTVFFREGIYNQRSTISISYKIGNSSNPICFFNYPGESPIFDGTSFSNLTLKCGLKITFSSFLHFKGLTFRRYNQELNNHFVIGISDQDCSHIKFENCTSKEIEGNAFQTHNSNFIYYINCDAYKCADTLRSIQPGNGGCGFSFTGKPSSGSGYISYYGCRAWLASDDGFHGNYQGYVVLDNCWSWSNGYLEGSGNGFKPAYILADVDPLARRLSNCIAAYNKWNGFHENTYEQGRINIEVFNCTSVGNGNGYSIPNSTKWTDNVSIYRNNVAYANKYHAISAEGTYTHSNNSWDYPILISNTDFINIEHSELLRSRKADGSLPDIDFLKLAPTAYSFIDKGDTTLGLPYNGKAPDLGAFECDRQPDGNFYPTIKISSPKEGSEFIAPGPITISVVVADKEGPISRVDLYADGEMIGTIPAGQDTFEWNNVLVGHYSICAVAVDASGARATTAALNINAIKRATPEEKKDDLSARTNLFPNPNNGNLTLFLTEPFLEETTIRILSLVGKPVYSGTLHSYEMLKKLYLDNLEPGQYVMIITGAAIVAIKRFIKI